MAAALSSLLSYVRVPADTDKIYKDECMYSFESPESENGLYICLSNFYGLGRQHVQAYYEKTGQRVFLHLRRIKRKVKQDDEPAMKKPVKLAIGLEGGFDAQEQKYIWDDVNSIVILPGFTTVDLADSQLPDKVQLSVAAVLAAESAMMSEELAALAGTWDGEMRQTSRHAENLLQLSDVKKVPPHGWRCERCDLTTNLWLNLTDGKIHCGRRFFDGTGGNNHAVEHYKETGYPLAVKLGTITASGADVYSYDEDDMVIDSRLPQHLAHFGILNMGSLEKTEKTMLELEIDLNQRTKEWDVIQESGSSLQPLFGPGYTGMHNLGNSCYMNSVMQVLFSLSSFLQKYVNGAAAIFDSTPIANVNADFASQMSKLGSCLQSGVYSAQSLQAGGEVVLPFGVRPTTFKHVAGKGHAEFSTKRQQDALEFALHVFTLLERSSRGSSNPAESFRFTIEDRIQCIESRRVQYNQRKEFVLSLPVPLEKALNKEEVAAYESRKAAAAASGQKTSYPAEEVVRPRITLQSCLDSYANTELIDDFYSTALKRRSQATKSSKLVSFPTYLLIQLQKFTLADDWSPKKLDVSVDVPEELDLHYLKAAGGLQAGEEELPSSSDAGGNAAAATSADFVLNEDIIAQLCDMGFPFEGCKKAVYNTRATGDLEAATNWLMEHLQDPDLDTPLQLPTAAATSSSNPFVPNEESLSMLMSMGFSRERGIKALRETNNSTERAIEWIFSHADEVDAGSHQDANPSDPPSGSSGAVDEVTSTKYKLKAFISHMGTSTSNGHYVCHIFKDNRWVIYNDEKVATSEHPPKDLAYMLFYEKC